MRPLLLGHHKHTSSLTRPCPNCGTVYTDISHHDKRRIAELEAQVKILTDKATAAGMVFSGVRLCLCTLSICLKFARI
jgi:hypothetical protein